MLALTKKIEKHFFVTEMINFPLRELIFSGHIYFSYTERLAPVKVEQVLWLQRNGKKVKLLPIYRIAGI